MNLTSFRADSFAPLVHKRTIWFAVLVAPLFTLIALAQTLFVRHETWQTIRAEQEVWAREIKSQIAYNDRWNLKGYRNASITTPGWFVIASNGLVIDIEGFIPDFFPTAKLPDESVIYGPKTIRSEVGEEWSLLARKLDHGI